MTAWPADAPSLLALAALGGAIGSMARFWVSGVIARRFGETFPWGTLAVNVSGAATIGVLAALLIAPDTHAVRNPTVWAALVTGVLGSYTTVSSFSLQTLALARNGEGARAAANVALSLVLCLGAAGSAWLATRQAVALWGG
jgi:CrcB protein